MASIYDLAYERVSRMGPCSASTKRLIIDEVRNLIDSGWTDDDVRMGANRRGDNMIDPYRFYYHSQFHIASPPPKISVNLETGDITELTEPWFLEMRASYTVKDLYRYYVERLNITEKQTDRAIGALKWLVNHYDLEHVLFMIDAYRSAYADGNEPVPGSPLAIREYEQEATEALEQKQSEMTVLGVDKVVPRERKPLPLR